MITPKRQIVRLGRAGVARLYAGVDRRDGRQCRKTGFSLGDRAEHHHRQYLSRQGSDVASNLVTLYGPGNTQGTHGWAHSSAEARLLGYSIPAFVEDVEEVPIKIMAGERGFVWARLFDDFTIGYMTEQDAANEMRRLGIWRDGESA
jgi:hypothetical protein